MLQATLVGNLGADAEKKESNGRKFSTFRIAHNEKWTDKAGQPHNSTVWVDCVMSDHPKVVDYLKAGQNVLVMGDVSLRVYSSERDRCMKAGMTISVRTIELLGGPSDRVPSRLYDKDGVLHEVRKLYYTDVDSMELKDAAGRVYNVDTHSWVEPEDIPQENNNQAKDNAPKSK